MTEPLKSRISTDMKTAPRAGDKARLGTIRLMLAAIRQREIDSRRELDDVQVLAVLDKMIKQRRESIAQYASARRADLVIDRLIDAAQTQTGASGMQDMASPWHISNRSCRGAPTWRRSAIE